MSDFNNLKPFELSYWEDIVEKVPASGHSDFYNKFRGFSTKEEDLSFWHSARNWKETFLTQSENEERNGNKWVKLKMGKDGGASEEISSNFSTTITDFLPNTQYTLFFEMEFTNKDGGGYNLPSWDNYQLLYPNSDNFQLVTLIQSNTGSQFNNEKTIFDSDIIVGYNNNGFNLNDSVFRGNDEGLIIENTNNGKFVCVARVKTNDFLVEENLIGAWTFFNVFKLGNWEANIRLRFIQGTIQDAQDSKDFFQSFLDANEISSSNYPESIKRKNSEDPLGLLRVSGEDEDLLSFFQNKIKEDANIYFENSYGGSLNTTYFNISDNIKENFQKEIENFFENYLTNNPNQNIISSNSSPVAFYEECFSIAHTYFPFIPKYGTTSKSDMILIKNYNNGIFSEFFDDSIYAGSSSFFYCFKDYYNKFVNNEDLESSRTNFLYRIKSYIDLIIENFFIVNSNNDDKYLVNTAKEIEFLITQVVCFYLNNSIQLRKIFRLLYREIDNNLNQAKNSNINIDIFSANKNNIIIYMLSLLFSCIKKEVTLSTSYIDQSKVYNNLFIYDQGQNPSYISQLGLYAVKNISNKFLMNDLLGKTGTKKEEIYILTKILFMGRVCFGLTNNTSDSDLENLIGFVPWLDYKYSPNTSINTNFGITKNDLMNLSVGSISNSLSGSTPTVNFEKDEEYYLKEKKIFTFGGDQYNNYNSAKDIEFKRSSKDISTLTFSLYDSYYDRNTSKYCDNPYVPYLKNESKIKLFYNNNWYDFFITNIQESYLSDHKITYTAKDAFVLELSKIGFNKTFNTDLNNNIGNIDELSETLLEGTQWSVGNNDDIIQYTEQPVFLCKITEEIEITNNEIDITVAENNFILLFYNEIVDELKENKLHCFYNSNLTDENYSDYIIDGTIDSNRVPIYTIKKIQNNTPIEYEAISLKNYKKPNFINSNNFELLFSIRGKQIVQQPIVHYNKPLNKYVYEYIDTQDTNEPEKIYYGYETREYSTDTLVENLLPHGENFINTDAWYISNGKNSFKTQLDLNVTNDEFSVTDQSDSTLIDDFTTDSTYSFLELSTNIKDNSGVFGQPHGFLFNTDLTYNYNKLDHLNIGDEFALRLSIERGIDKSIGSTGTSYQDDQITMLESICPFLYFYPSKEKVQQEYLSAFSKEDQIFSFWYPTNYSQSGKECANLSERVQCGNLIPVYWGDNTQEKLPIFYTYEENIIDWVKENIVAARYSLIQLGFYYLFCKMGDNINTEFSGAEKTKINSLPGVFSTWFSETSVGSNQYKLTGTTVQKTDHLQFIKNEILKTSPKYDKWYLTENGRINLIYFIGRINNENTINIVNSSSQIISAVYNDILSSQSYNYFDCKKIPIISNIIDRLNGSNLSVDTGDLTKTDNLVIKQYGTSNKLRYLDTATLESDSSIIRYYVIFSLNNENGEEEYTQLRNLRDTDIERYDIIQNINENGNLEIYFKPVNINVKGITDENGLISGLPFATNSYYNDFDIIMRSRAVWKPVQYSPNGTCIFESCGTFKGKTIINSNGVAEISQQNLSYGDLLSKNIGLFFLIKPTLYDNAASTSESTMKIKMAISSVEMFRKYLDKKNGEVITPQDIISSSINTLYSLYDPTLEQNKNAINKNDIQLAYEEYYLDSRYEKVIDLEGNKINTITINNSNIYNIAQKLAEIFDVWLNIEVQHNEDGSLTLDESTHKPNKKISFKNREYIENYTGIKYGINLKNLQRQLDSTDIINKLIVKDNKNEYGINGICSITRSGLNVSGSTNVFNFDYYINQGILNGEEVYNILYNKIYPKTYIIGHKLNQLAEELNTLEIKIRQTLAEVEFNEVTFNNIEKELNDNKMKIYSLTGYDYSLYLSNPKINDSSNPFYIYKNSNQFLSYLNKTKYYYLLSNKYKNALSTSRKQLEQEQQQYISYTQQRNGLIYQRDYLLNKIYELYAPYIKEGSWISEDYLDDDKYYLDAEKKLSESSKPKVTYTIDIVDLSSLPEFKSYIFNLKDKTFIEDPDIFGYDGSNRPCKEEVIITELTDYPLSPDKNKITIQNYKTQFDDLFQRMASTIQTVEYKTDNYNKRDTSFKNKILYNKVQELI